MINVCLPSLDCTHRHLVPGAVSPQLPVPASIPRPEYVGKPAPAKFTGSEVKSAETIEKIRIASRIAAQAIQEVGKHHPARRHHGPAGPGRPRVPARPPRLSVHARLPRLPKSLCSSLNEVICHGIPDSTVVQDGDIVNIDITAFIGGVHGDTNYTFLAGDVDEESRLLVERTRESLDVPSAPWPRAANQRDRPVPSSPTRSASVRRRPRLHGHGVGEAFHTGLIIPHYDAAGLQHGHGDRHGFHDRTDADMGTVDWGHVGR